MSDYGKDILADANYLLFADIVLAQRFGNERNNC